MQERLAALRRRLNVSPEAASDDLLLDLLRDAEIFILCYTGLLLLPDALQSAQVQYAAITYRRLGAEGETAHQEGDVRMAFDTARAEIMAQLRGYRLAYAGLSRAVDEVSA